MRDHDASIRAQLLATEHWSLLASRSTTQSEVLSRIAMFLTLVSAGLVSLALVGQATQFSGEFAVFAITVLVIVNLVGMLTQVRVSNVAMEDLMYVLAMNRLRAAYAELDPGIVPYLMASRFDDNPGMQQTYYFLGRNRGFSQVAGSSVIFITAVNTTLLGLLTAAIAGLAGAPLLVAAIIGAGCGLLYFGIVFTLGGRRFYGHWKTYEPFNPTPTE